MERTKTLHGFRAGAATELPRQDASPVHDQRLLRYENAGTTRGYLDPDALEIENLVRNLCLLLRVADNFKFSAKLAPTRT